MKVKILVMRVGSTGTLAAGEEYDLPETEARRLIDAGKAEPVAAPVETTMQAASPPRKKKAKHAK